MNSDDPSSKPSSDAGNQFAEDSVESGMSSCECSDDENKDREGEKYVRTLRERSRSMSPSKHLVKTASGSRLDVEGVKSLGKLGYSDDPDVETLARVTSGLSLLDTPVESSSDSKNSELAKEETELSAVLRSADNLLNVHDSRIAKEWSEKSSTTANNSKLGKKLPKGTVSQANLGTNVGSPRAIGSGVPKLSFRTPTSSRSAMSKTLSGSVNKSNGSATLPPKKPGPMASSRNLTSSATSRVKGTEAEQTKTVIDRRPNKQPGGEALSRDENGNVTPGRRERNPILASSQMKLPSRVKATSASALSSTRARGVSATRGASATTMLRSGPRAQVGDGAPEKRQQEPFMSGVGILDANQSKELDLNPKMKESLTEIFSGKKPPL